MTISRKPAAARRSRCQTISGLPPATSSGLGVWSVSGRMRSPRPAARIIAFISSLLLQFAAAPTGGGKEQEAVQMCANNGDAADSPVEA